MGTSIEVDTPRAVGAVTEFFFRAIESLDAWRDDLARDIRKSRGSGTLTSNRLDVLVEPYAARSFAAPGLPVYGAGFVAAHDLVADASSHLSWWQGPKRAKLTLAAQGVNKARIDYSELEWYRVPELTGKAHIAGPYVDYLCSDEYTLTAAVPVKIDGEFVGVGALDLLIDGIEHQLADLISDDGREITLVNNFSRVVLSSNPSLATGDSLRGSDLEHGRMRYDCPGLSLAVLAG